MKTYLKPYASKEIGSDETLLAMRNDEIIVGMLKKGLLRAEQDGVGEITWAQYQALIEEDFERNDISLSKGPALLN